MKTKKIYGDWIKWHGGERPVPVVRQFQAKDGTWHGFIDERHFQNTVEDGGWPLRSLYTQEAIDTLRAQLAEAQRDAERWRYLRDSGDDSIYAMRFDIDGDTPISGAELDASIDAAKGGSNE